MKCWIFIGDSNGVFEIRKSNRTNAKFPKYENSNGQRAVDAEFFLWMDALRARCNLRIRVLQIWSLKSGQALKCEICAWRVERMASGCKVEPFAVSVGPRRPFKNQFCGWQCLPNHQGNFPAGAGTRTFPSQSTVCPLFGNLSFRIFHIFAFVRIPFQNLNTPSECPINIQHLILTSKLLKLIPTPSKNTNAKFYAATVYACSWW